MHFNPDVPFLQLALWVNCHFDQYPGKHCIFSYDIAKCPLIDTISDKKYLTFG